MKRINSKFKTIGIIILLLLVITSTTLAWFVWSSNNNTNMKVIIGSFADISFKSGQDIVINNLAPSFYYDDGIVSSFKVRKKRGITGNFKINIYLNITSIASELNIDAFKYILLSSTDNSNYTTVVEGNFSNVTVGKLNLVNAPLGDNSTYYKLYIWLDGSSEQSTNIQDKSFVSSVNVEVSPSASSFASDDWYTIASSTTSTVYNIGDTKCIALDGFTTTNDNGCSNGEFLVRIANKNAPEECSGDDYSQTACGFVVEFVDIITTNNMNETNTNVGSWNLSALKTYLDSTIYNALPEELQEVIIDTKSVTGYGGAESTNFTTNSDKLYLLSPMEVYGNNDEVSLYDSAYTSSRQLDYYLGKGVTNSNYAYTIKQNSGVNSSWWLRTPNYTNEEGFEMVNSNGSLTNIYASTTSGVSPAFRIGS